MSQDVSSLLSKMRNDQWRQNVGFSQEMEHVQLTLLNDRSSYEECRYVLNQWIQHHQTCLFGRIGAKLGLISYCILKESDLQADDHVIGDKIQEARTLWTKEGYEGKKSAFVILCISPKIVFGIPDETMNELARKLCSLYLMEEVTNDRIFLDQIFLEKPGQSKTTWMWDTGVNYFCSQGDRRWWQDHRIPGGMAFSVNSVGHMIKSGVIAKKMNELEEILAAPSEDLVGSRIDSTGAALQYAMLTIDNATEAVSGKATRLLPLPGDLSQLPVLECPITLPNALKGKNFCEYSGYYHTDMTLPSEYFMKDVERPASIQSHSLDFSYLFAKEGDPDRARLLFGRRIRAGAPGTGTAADSGPEKYSKAYEQEIQISHQLRLVKALGGGS